MKFLAVVATLLLFSAPAAAAPAQPTIAVLPLSAADPNMPYGLLPSPSELKIMTTQLQGGLRAGGLPLVTPGHIPAVVTAAGFDQTSPIRACAVAACAQRIGRTLGADAVIVGSVTRAMAVIWGTAFSIVDVHTGKVLGEMNVGYKGDVQAMERGEYDAGGCLARIIKHEKACAPDPGW